MTRTCQRHAYSASSTRIAIAVIPRGESSSSSATSVLLLPLPYPALPPPLHPLLPLALSFTRAAGPPSHHLTFSFQVRGTKVCNGTPAPSPSSLSSRRPSSTLVLTPPPPLFLSSPPYVLSSVIMVSFPPLSPLELILFQSMEDLGGTSVTR